MARPPRQGGGGTRAPALTYVSVGAGVLVHVVVPGGGGFTVQNCLSSALLLVRSRDSTYSIHGSDSVKWADSSTFSLCERSWALVITTFHSSQ